MATPSAAEPSGQEEEENLRITALIDRLENETTLHKKRMEAVKRSLNSKDTAPEEKTALRKKLELMKTELDEKEKRLKHLHKENKKTTLFAILVFVLAVIIYVSLKSTTEKPHPSS